MKDQVTKPAVRVGQGRPRSQTKEAAILDAACRHFTSHGFDGTRMDEVAVSSGVTKATVYAKYHSKAELFFTTLRALACCMPSVDEVMAGPVEDVQVRLRLIAARLLEVALSTPAVGICRMLILPMESEPRLGADYWEKTVEPYLRGLSAVFRDINKRQQLRIPDPMRAASNFFGLVVGDPALRMLIASQRIKESEADEHVVSVVALFMAAHGKPAPSK